MSGKALIDRNKWMPNCFDVAFLWRCGDCFVMDNHRCALWCWLQCIDLSQKYNILHIDRHFDALYWPPNVWDSLSTQQPIHELSIEQYLAAERPCSIDQTPVFRDDNSVSAFVHFYSHQLNELHIASHRKGSYSTPRWDKTVYSRCDQLPVDLEWWFESAETSREHKWIVNIDVDYFFYPDNTPDSRRLFSSEYVAHLFGGLRKQLDAGRIQVVTIALSPEYTGTWNKARAMCLEICGHLGIPLGETHIRPYERGS